MSIAPQRDAAVQAALDQIKTLAVGPVDRPALGRILAILQQLAERPELWSEVDFPPPEAGERQARYLISEEPNQTFALYLNVLRPGKLTPVHNHTTWACIAAVEGVEHNHLYTRLDDGSLPGVARLAFDHTLEVGPGQGVALLPDDIHAVQIHGDAIIRHLHLYGRALETLSERIMFDLDNDTYTIMPIGVTTRRGPSAA